MSSRYQPIRNEILNSFDRIKKPTNRFLVFDVHDPKSRTSIDVFPLETLLNAADDSSSPAEYKWSFDKDTLMIYNNKYWKGFDL